MLRMGCISTFIAFFKVFVATGNCCASLCAEATIAALKSNVPSTNPRSAALTLFMEPPSGIFQLSDALAARNVLHNLHFLASSLVAATFRWPSLLLFLFLSVGRFFALGWLFVAAACLP